jgi:hypothetical protein
MRSSKPQHVAGSGGDVIDIRHPEISVQLTGEDGNGFLIASRVRMALKKVGVSEQEREEFWNDAPSADYNHLLVTVIKWVDALRKSSRHPGTIPDPR